MYALVFIKDKGGIIPNFKLYLVVPELKDKFYIETGTLLLFKIIIHIVKGIFLKSCHSLFVVFRICYIKIFFLKINTLCISFFSICNKLLLTVNKITYHVVLPQLMKKFRKNFLHIDFHIMRQSVGCNRKWQSRTKRKRYFC